MPEGSVFALIGPNGTGKTTTIRMLMNILRPDRGDITVLGTPSRELGPKDFERIGYVSEGQRLPDGSDARPVLRLPAQASTPPGTAASRRSCASSSSCRRPARSSTSRTACA